jgi:basic membrane protein A
MKRTVIGLLAATALTVPAFAQEEIRPGLLFDLGGKFDKSFNESSYEGAERFREETGVDYVEFEISNEAQREQALRRFAEDGRNPIVMAGFSWGSALEIVAQDYPEIDFAIIDMVVDQPNVRSVVFKEQEGSYLVGKLAGLKSETGTVGFVGGMEIPLIGKFECGYVGGVKAADPDATVIRNYTGDTPAAWNDPVTAGELAKAQMDAGADIVFAAAGGSGLGVLQAMADAGEFSIGVDSNQNHLHPGSVLTSMLKRVDNAVYTAFQEAGDDATFKPGRIDLGLADEGVGYALDENNADLITDEMQAKVEELKAGVIDGSVEVHDYYTDNACPL